MDHIKLDPKEYDPELCDLLDKMTVPKVEERLGYNTDFIGIMKHPYFKDVNWDDVRNKKLKPTWYTSDKKLVKYNEMLRSKKPLPE